MGSTPENASRYAQLGLYTCSNELVRAYFTNERRWVMDALPCMPEHEWEMYIQWVKSVMDPLPRKGAWQKLKSP